MENKAKVNPLTLLKKTSFGTSDRFVRMPNSSNTLFYENRKSDFDRSFHGYVGDKALRFEYLPSKRKQGSMPASSYYSSID